MGFAVPLAGWFRGPLKERARDAIGSATLRDTGIFEPAFLKRMLDEHESGMRDFSAAIWSVLMFEAFCRRVNERMDLTPGLETQAYAAR